MLQGMVFSILRGSMYDGPGIRTTVFLKGCNLRCLWCHNPEGLDSMPQLAYRNHQCIYCGRCAVVCPQGVHQISSDEHTVRHELCQACGRCVDVCPAGALQLYGHYMTVDEVFSPVWRDRAFYREDGGLTLSGGEPLLQPDFALELLQMAKAHGLHTCIETAGCLPESVMRKAAAVTDLFLFDYKATGAERHRSLTGVDNTRILKNLDMLIGMGVRVRLRCPIVPGCNDNMEHFQAIVSMARHYPELDGVEIMPYHDMGISKAQALGVTSRYTAPTATAEQKAQWKQWMHILGADQIQIND